MNFLDVRKLFIGAGDKIFLDSASMGLVPTVAKIAINKFMDLVVTCPENSIADQYTILNEIKINAVEEAANLLNAKYEQIVLIENTTQGLNIAANSIPFRPSDEVIILNTEYLQVAIPFIKKHQAKKLTIVKMTSPLEALSTNDFEKMINKNTKAICLSAVQWCTGERVFSYELGELCRSKGIFLIIDGVQEAGALKTDMRERSCDFYIAGGHKWLNAPFGCGIMYMSERAMALEPPSYGYLNLDPPLMGWNKVFQDPEQTPFREYAFPARASSFATGGTNNFPGAIGLAASLKLVNSLGAAAVEQRVIELTQFLRSELKKIGATIASPEAKDKLSGITIFRLSDSYERDLRALERLEEQRIFLSIRYTNGHGGLRASTHYYNNEEEIQRFCFAVKNL